MLITGLPLVEQLLLQAGVLLQLSIGFVMVLQGKLIWLFEIWKELKRTVWGCWTVADELIEWLEERELIDAFIKFELLLLLLLFEWCGNVLDT